MTPEQQQLLHQKKEQLQLRLAVQEFADRDILPLLEILDKLHSSGVGFIPRQLLGVKSEWQSELLTVLAAPPFAGYGLAGLPQSSDTAPITALLERYPTTHPTRYLPDIPMIGMAEEELSALLLSVLDSLRVREQHAYLYYFRYAILLEVNLPVFAKQVATDIFNLWHGDVLIFPEDYRWLIAYSDRDEWYAGGSKQ